VKFLYRPKEKGTCDACIKIHAKRNIEVNCLDCKQGFVEPLEENWECLGIVEKYGTSVFMDLNSSTANINTNSIKNVLESEGYTGLEYNKLFNDLVIFFTTAVSTIRENTRK